MDFHQMFEMISVPCVFTILWWFIFIFRYLRLFVNVWSFYTHENIPIPEIPTYISQDVTVVIPCLPGEGIEATVRSVLATRPAKVILVTIDANLERAHRMVRGMGVSNDLVVLSVPKANKRKQMMHALSEIHTPITIFADDDVTWPTTLLPWILAPFEDEATGGVGTNQWLRDDPQSRHMKRVWRFLNLTYLERRNFDCAACNRMDGGLPCLSGRTVAYRTNILKDLDFIKEFENEVWTVRLWGHKLEYRLAVDDDNFITRWVYSHGSKIAFQCHPEAEVLTELEANSKYLKQCLRWSRSNWRSNITSMFIERNVWFQHPWSAYAVFQTTMTHWAVLWDIGLWYFRPAGDFSWWLLLLVMVFSKIIKLVPIFIREPSKIVYLPVSILFGYFHSICIKSYAAFTLHVTAWGSRDGADEDDDMRMTEIGQSSGKKLLLISKKDVTIDYYHLSHELNFIKRNRSSISLKD